jgi:L-aspartate oxidase
MPKYHELAELAPRDVVARAITHELELVKRPDAVVYLDLTHLNAERVRQRFPMIYSTCMRYNIDIATELVPIRPAAHYAMGGVRTDLMGRTSLPGLYAAGEVACTGVHGANRLASNSLLEGLVYGVRAADEMRQHMRATSNSGSVSTPVSAAGSNGQGNEVEKLIRKVQSLMWQHVGVVRDGKALQQVVPELRNLQSQIGSKGDRRSREAANIVQSGLLIARSALAREESRGAHYRLDHPLKNDVKYRKHSVISGDNLGFA